MTRARSGRGAGPGIPGLLVVFAALIASCSESTSQPLPRSSRYGIFRDLVLYLRRDGEGGPFFLDRFEVTRADWHRYLVSHGRDDGPWGEGPPSADTAQLPVTRISLDVARRYAAWRFCRLPRRDEWRYAATGRGHYQYPWGDVFRPAWVNSAELGLAAPTRVGTFESGREEEGAYDLLGNVAEWTETVEAHWFSARSRFAVPGWRGAGLSTVWAGFAPSVPEPTYWWLRRAGRHLPRLVVGGHFRAFAKAVADQVSPPDSLDGLLTLWERAPTELGDTVGVRLASDPLDLVRALLREPRAPSDAEVAELQGFLRAPGHAEVLRPVLAAQGPGPFGPLHAILAEELGS